MSADSCLVRRISMIHLWITVLLKEGCAIKMISTLLCVSLYHAPRLVDSLQRRDGCSLAQRLTLLRHNPRSRKKSKRDGAPLRVPGFLTPPDSAMERGTPLRRLTFMRYSLA